MTWVIDPKTTMALIPTAPHGMLHGRLAELLRRHFPHFVEIAPDAQGAYQPVVAMRNQAIRDIVLTNKTFEHFVFFDNDLAPDGRIHAMFEVEADIVGATYALARPESWLRPDDVHCGALMFHRKVVEAMKPPYFQHIYTPDGMELAQCDCGYFRDKAKALGFTIARAGWSDHQNKRTWC